MTEIQEEAVTPESRVRDDGVTVISRAAFKEHYFDYKPGQHVAFIGPTQRGKTTLAFELLEFAATPELPAYVAVCKPRDPATEKAGKKLGYRRVSEWPPPPRIRDWMNGRPPGYLVWPDLGDMSSSVSHAGNVTARLLSNVYANGGRNKKAILVLDDTVVKSKVFGLDREMTTILTMSGAMGVGAWTFVQKPTDAGKTALWSYSQSEHIFLGRDPDRRNRRRFDEIGGFDGAKLDRVNLSLKPYQFLYLERSHGYMCIVDSK